MKILRIQSGTKKIFNQISTTILFVFISLFTYSQPRPLTFLPDKSIATAIITDPNESQSMISFNSLSKNKIIDYDMYVPFAFGFSKAIVQWGKNEIGGDCSAQTQFGWRKEDNIYMHGYRKSLLNIDYQVGLIYTRIITKEIQIKTRLFHRSSHLGDDYVLLNSVKPTGYWMNDPSNFEQLNITYIQKIKYLTTYATAGYVLRNKNRKPLMLEAGAFASDFRPKEKSNLFLGFDIKALENNNFNPSLKCMAGFKVKRRKPIYFVLEYYNGHLPYSRYESSLIVQWFGAGIYLDSVL